MENNPHYRQMIRVEDLKVGMYVENIFDKNGKLLISENNTLTSPAQIEALRKRGVKIVYIDITKGVAPTAQGNESEKPGMPTAIDSLLLDEQKREREYYHEFTKAKLVYNNSLETATEALKSAKRSNTFSFKKVRNSAEGIVESILRNPDALVSLTQIKGFDEYTYTHSINVGILMTLLAEILGYQDDQLLEIGTGGILHDIGKMQIPDRILNKPDKLTAAEFRIIMNHPKFGLEMIAKKANISFLVRTIIIQHHERFDGSGYPMGLKGDQIHEVGLIAAVADVYDALTSDRVYRGAETPQKALATIFKGCDKEYSRNVVEHFTKHLGIYPVGSFVRLACGLFGVVTKVEKGHLLSPHILILFDKNGTKLEKPYEMDLTDKIKDTEHAPDYKIEISLNPKRYGINIADYLHISKLGIVAVP